jgi:hypothetical protein
MNQLKKATLSLDACVQEGYDLLDEFKSAYKRLEALLPEMPKSMDDEKKQIRELMLEIAAASRNLKSEIKNANVVSGHIKGHSHWKAAVFACFGDDGLAAVYKWFEEYSPEERE